LDLDLLCKLSWFLSKYTSALFFEGLLYLASYEVAPLLFQLSLKPSIKPSLGATLPYYELSDFRISFIPLYFPLVLGVSSIICVAIKLM